MRIIASILFFAHAAFAQIVTTYDSRFGVEPVKSAHRAIDVGVTDTLTNPDFDLRLRSVRVPALYDLRYGVGVHIVGDLAQAETDLAAAIADRFPARAALRGKDRAAEARAAALAALAANRQADGARTIAGLRLQVMALASELERLSLLVESLIEEQGK